MVESSSIEVKTACNKISEKKKRSNLQMKYMNLPK